MNDPVTLGRKLQVAGETVRVIGKHHALVESRSRPGQYHSVSWEFDDKIGKETWICTCESGGFRGDCRHIRIIDLWNVGKVPGVFVNDPMDEAWDDHE